MSRRRGRKGRTVNGSQPDAPSSAVASSGPPALPNTDPGANVPQLLVNAFKALFERAADTVRGEVASTGKVRPTAIFVYENKAGTSEASTTKTVILDWRDELQKEA